jgi:hypothetical protein
VFPFLQNGFRFAYEEGRSGDDEGGGVGGGSERRAEVVEDLVRRGVGG